MVLYITASWCGPCKAFGPVVEKAMSEGYDIVKVDADERRDVLEQYDVKSVPTLIKIKDNVEVDRHVGVMASKALREFLTD